MDNRSDAELLIEARVFDLPALAAIYDRYSPRLYAYSMRLLGDECLAEDCVAETFSRFLKQLRIGHGPEEHLQAYLFRVAHNWITDQYRRQPPPPIELEEHFPGDEASQPENQADRTLQQARVRGALRMLTPDQRQVILLRFLEGWDNEEVASAVQKPVGAVKALQHRALATLRKWLLRFEKENVYENG